MPKELDVLKAYVEKQEAKVTNAQQDILKTEDLAELSRLVYSALKDIENEMHCWPKQED